MQGTASNTDPFDRSNLTRSQFLIWMGQRLEPGVPLYNMVLAFHLAGRLDTGALSEAFRAVVSGSDALRTVFEEKDGIPERRVLDRVPAELEVHDFASARDPGRHAEAWIAERAARAFKTGSSLFDAAVLRLSSDRAVWYLNQHHLITDAWSTSLLYRHVLRGYDALVAGGGLQGMDLPPYERYVEFECAQRATAAHARAKEHWEGRFGRATEPLDFYGRTNRGASTRTVRVPCALGPERSRALRALALEKEARSLTPDISLFAIFASVLFALLERIGGVREVTIGAPSHNRATSAFKETLGLFIEIFPLRVEIARDETFAGLLQKVLREVQSFLVHARPGTSSGSANASFEVLLNYITASFEDAGGLAMRSEWIHPGHGDSGHSLRLQVHDFDRTGAFLLHFDLNTEVFPPETHGRVVEHFLRLLDALIADRHQRVAAVDLLSPGERRWILEDFNATRAPDPGEATVPQLFGEAASRWPERTALRFGDVEVRYAELGARVRRLADDLRRQGVGREVLVGIALPRSVELVTAVLAVLEAGGAYVPIDPSGPRERIRSMLEDSGASSILTQAELAAGVPRDIARVLVIGPHGRLEATGAAPESDAAARPATARDLAYVIFTSGSTGRPKGVMVEHGSLAGYLHWARREYLDDGEWTFPLFTSFSFDLTVTSLFLPLVTGNTLAIYPEEEAGGGLDVLRVIEDRRANIIKLTPSHLSLIKDLPLHETVVRRLIAGGEDLRSALALSIHERFAGKVEIFNEYGPTEATVACMIHRFDPERDRGVSVPIGRPADNARIYLLDAEGQPVPRGVKGEVYISGTGVARGYIGRADLTRERFLPDPLVPGVRMYRTGDLARMDARGDLVFLGRADEQVKLRGFRIELGEVEAELSRHPAVRECVVDVVRPEARTGEAREVSRCVRCGLPSNFPETRIDEAGVCSLCRGFDEYRDQAMRYFQTMDDLRALFNGAKSKRRGEYDCLMLLSGGKDSTYALYRLVEMGLEVLAFSLDNGFISEGAKANIRRAVEDLGVDLVFGSTPAMPRIFADSLSRFSNVCNGCFKTIYTLSANLARERGIHTIVTGLSRGQIFETRLADLFRNRIFDPAEIDRTIVEARKAYHRVDDAVRRLLDVEIFTRDETFEEVRFVDFYRYCDVGLEEMLEFLEKRAPWIRPADTGRSTNCLINEVGIFVHKGERGYHNYALPYSWDVRLGHKTREAALAELDDEIDAGNVRRILTEIGYEPAPAGSSPGSARLQAYYVADRDLDARELRDHLRQALPAHMVPAGFLRLDHLPLGPSGKVDRRALPRAGLGRSDPSGGSQAPRSRREEFLLRVWKDVLGLEDLGIHDDFMEAGGDSILAIQITARAGELGLAVHPRQVFEHPTVADLALVAAERAGRDAEQGPVAGSAPLTPIERWFFGLELEDPSRWTHVVALELLEAMRSEVLEAALARLIEHHDALRSRYTRSSDGWRKDIAGSAPSFELEILQVPEGGAGSVEDAARVLESRLAKRMSLGSGCLLEAGLLDCGPHAPGLLVLAVHHLAVDGVSWRVLLEDLAELSARERQGREPRLPAKTASVLAWARALERDASAPATAREMEFWRAQGRIDCPPLPRDRAVAEPATCATARLASFSLEPALTERLVREARKAHRAGVDEMVLAAVLHALWRWTGGRSYRIDIESHGRAEVEGAADVSRTVGWFTSIFPVAFELPPDAGAERAIACVKEAMRPVPRNGIGYGLLRHIGPAGARSELEAFPAAEVLFNHLGDVGQLVPPSSFASATGELRLLRDARGRLPYALEFNSLVSGGRLRVDVVFSESIHEPATIERLGGNVLEALRALGETAGTPGSGSLTPADFPLSGLDREGLEALSRALGAGGDSPSERP